VARRHRLTVAAWVPRDTTDRHIDSETGRGAFFFGFAAPKAVLAVLTGPAPAFNEGRTRAAHGAGLRFARRPRLRTFSRRREEKAGFASASGLLRPLEWSGEDEVRDRLGCHDVPLSRAAGLFRWLAATPTGD